MHKRLTFKHSAAAAALLAVASLVAACGSSGSSTPAAAAKPLAAAATPRVIPIVMKDPGCHWFRVGGKDRTQLVVDGATAFRNLDEAALIVKGAGSTERVDVGKTLTVATAGTYEITMAGQAPDDNHLKLVVT